MFHIYKMCMYIMYKDKMYYIKYRFIYISFYIFNIYEIRVCVCVCIYLRKILPKYFCLQSLS